MKKIFIVTTVMISLAVGASCAYAGRPFSTEDAGVVGKDIFQLELGMEYVGGNNDDRKYSLQFVPIYGLTEQIELSAEFSYKRADPKEGEPIEGFEDIVVAVKTLAVKEGYINPAIVIKTALKFDNGDEKNGMGSGDNDLSLVTVATKRIEKITVHINFGYTFVGKRFDPGLKDYTLYGVAGEYPVTEEMNLMMELYGESYSHFHLGAFKHRYLHTLIGLSCQLKEKIVFTSGIKAGLTTDSPDFGLSVGLSVEF